MGKRDSLSTHLIVPERQEKRKGIMMKHKRNKEPKTLNVQKEREKRTEIELRTFTIQRRFLLCSLNFVL